MKKIFSAEQIRRCECQTIFKQKINSYELMERAAKAFVKEFESRFSQTQKVLVIAGSGNNGGDALAIGRLLCKNHWRTETLFLPGTKISPDCQTNLQKAFQVKHLQNLKQLEEFEDYDLLIDGIFGSGISRPLTGFIAEVINRINQLLFKKISVDVPSGLYLNNPLNHSQVICSDLTITFEFPKLSFLLPESQKFVQEWVSVPIGLDKNTIAETPAEFLLSEKKDIDDQIRPREKFSHKGNFGHCLVIGGGPGMGGAVFLSCLATLKSGCGTVTLLTDPLHRSFLYSVLPEAMLFSGSMAECLERLPDEIRRFDAVLIGPGLGKEKIAQEILCKVIREFKRPIVFDADALNLLAQNKTLLSQIPEQSVLTPHFGEFRRLAGESENDFERIQTAKNFSKKHRCTLVLKGAHTAIFSPDLPVLFNATGNPKIAIPGSGDVLAGMITALIAQGHNPEKAAQIAVFKHGEVGDRVIRENPGKFLLASDLARAI